MIELPQHLSAYVAANPTRSQAHREMGIDRSDLGQSIVARLVNQGCTDKAIKAWFEAKQLRRYVEEKERGHGDDYLVRSIQKARNGRKPRASSSPICVLPETDHKQERGSKWVSPEAVLGIGAAHDGESYNRLQDLVASELKCSQGTARRHLKRLEPRYLTFKRVPGRGGPKIVLLTAEAKEFLAPSATPYERLCKKLFIRPMQVNKQKRKRPIIDQTKIPPPTQTAKNRPSPKKPLSREAHIGRTVRHLQRCQIGNHPRISFEGRIKKTFVQVLTRSTKSRRAASRSMNR